MAPFLPGPGLPFADVLCEQQIEEAMAAEGVCFGECGRAVYTPAITLWAFLSQVLQAGELRSCTAAVARVIVLLVALGRQPCSADTAAYCRTRAKLPAAVIRRLAVQVGNQLEARIPADWLWFGSYFLLALGLQRQVDWLARVHQARQVDVRRGQCIGRQTIAQAALAEGELPRTISFAAARQTIAASWDLLTRTPQALHALAGVQFTAIASHQVADRPDRVEPRAVKRRPKPQRLLNSTV